jgi:ABC-2 type transport system ATP-binding protein
MTTALTGVAKRFGGTTALDGVSIALEPGVTGLLGPNGAGKTTLLRILATVLAPDDGDVALLGLRPTGPDALHTIRRHLGYCPQESGLYPHFTPFEFVDYVAILKELHDTRARHAEVRRVLLLVGLESVMHKRIRKLSGGMRRRVALAQSLLSRPDLLVLDEPTAGLDPEQRLRFREVLSQRHAGQIVVLSTHQTEDVVALCQRVIVIDRGRVRFDGDVPALAATAAGRVWVGDGPDAGSRLSWIDGTGRHRHVGDPPAGAELAPSTLEDGYLLLVGSGAYADVSV